MRNLNFRSLSSTAPSRGTPPRSEICKAAERRLLLIATRDPRGPVSGRKLVLKTIIESVSAIGFDVMVAHFGPPETSEAFGGARYVSLSGPNAFELAGGLMGWLLRGSPSLNEALYASGRARQSITSLIADFQPDVIVSDMVRTAQYAEGAQIPWIADLDDLLSDRYRQTAAKGEGLPNLLGYHRAPLLRAALRLSKPALRLILEREASVLKRREIEIARAADLACLVNAAEAKTLSYRAGVDVANLPMAINPPTTATFAKSRSEGFVFVGGLDYAPNKQAVYAYDTGIAPKLRAAGFKQSALHVIGKCDPKDREQFSDSVILHGYVEDLDAALRRFEYLLVPEVVPGGVKTKIIHAMLNRLLVIAHDTALVGTGLEPYSHALVWKDEVELVEIIRRLESKEIEKGKILDNAYRWAYNNFRPDVIREKWRSTIEKRLAAPIEQCN